MAYAAYCDSFTDTLLPRRPAPLAADVCVLAVTVACIAAPCVRRAVARVADCGVLRCEPHLAGPDEGRVTLVLRLPRAAMGAVMDGVLRCVPSGEFGRLMPWAQHLAALEAASLARAH